MQEERKKHGCLIAVIAAILLVFIIGISLFQMILSPIGSLITFLQGEEKGVILEIPENGLPIPLFRQYDSSWALYPYGDGNMQTSGCGPTSVAMVTSYLTGEIVTPADIINWSGNRYHIPGVGMAWSIFSAAAEKYGYESRKIEASQIKEALTAGHPVIMSCRPGTFTVEGHFIVLRGLTEDGQVLVNDPSDNPQKNHINRSFSLNLIAREGKGFWESWKKDGQQIETGN